jgi:hypothetical protein
MNLTVTSKKSSLFLQSGLQNNSALHKDPSSQEVFPQHCTRAPLFSVTYISLLKEKKSKIKLLVFREYETVRLRGICDCQMRICQLFEPLLIV